MAISQPEKHLDRSAKAYIVGTSGELVMGLKVVDKGGLTHFSIWQWNQATQHTQTTVDQRVRRWSTDSTGKGTIASDSIHL